MTPLFVGVDGGGSHTRVVVADATGRELSRAESRGSAVRPGEAAGSAQVILEAVRRALEGQAGVVRALGVGVAGVGREVEREALERELEAGAVAQEAIVVSDAAIALEDAFGEGPGILLTAGTGSIAFGRGPTGTFARSGGWGPVIGDEGSGAWIGRRALGIVAASSDGREPETGLTAPLLDAVGLERVSELVPWAAAATPADLARLAPLVLEVAATGDLRANSLVTLAIEELGLHVRALARLLFGDERAAFQLALNGGLLQRGSLLRRRLEQRLKSMTPGAQLQAAEPVPARGAVRLAMRQTGYPIAPQEARPASSATAPAGTARPATTGA
jgi:glucosamine kinase